MGARLSCSYYYADGIEAQNLFGDINIGNGQKIQ